jgi:hypothetical protein
VVKQAIAILACVACVGGLRYAFGSRGQRETAPVAPASSAATTTTVYVSTPATPVNPTLLAAEVRAAVRAELAANRAPTAPGPETAAASSSALADSAQAADRAHAVVAAAQAKKRWTEEDRNALRPLLASMNDDDRREVLSTLVPAVNRQEIQLDPRVPLF